MAARIGILTVSDRASKGVYEDRGGPAIAEFLREALSCDWEPVARVIPDERPVIEATLKKQNVSLPAGEIGKVGLDPTKAAGQAFGVEGIPTVVLLDRAGVIRAYHVGYRADIREVLTKDIDSLLTGQPQAKD